MSIVGNQYFEAGQKPNASELNAVYDAIDTDTLNADNLDVEWANREHFDPIVSEKLNRIFTFDYDGTLNWTTTSEAWTTIENVVGTPSRIQPNYICRGKALVRVHATGLVSDLRLNPRDGDGTSAQINYNTYAFELYMTITRSGKSGLISLANCTYSFTPKAALTSSTPSYTSGLSSPINYRSFGFSGVAVLQANDVIDSIVLRACVGHAGNTLNVQHNHIQMIVVEN